MSEEQKPLSQAELIQLLQKTIQQLDGIVSKLNSETLENLPPSTILESLVINTEALATSLASTPKSRQEATTPFASATVAEEPSRQMPPLEVSAELITDEEVPSTWLDRLFPSFNSLQTWWDGVLATVRSLLPSAWQEKLSDWVLTGILATILVSLLLTTVLLLPQPSPEVAQKSPEVAELPEAIDTPLELIAPGTAEPIILEPAASPQLTPEQSLLEAIQTEVTDLTRQYPEGLILSVAADFFNSRLTITVGDTWYNLNAKRQNKLANTILQRAQRLDFRKLELLNAQATLIARNPVVGNEMVILQRSQNDI